MGSLLWRHDDHRSSSAAEPHKPEPPPGPGPSADEALAQIARESLGCLEDAEVIERLRSVPSLIEAVRLAGELQAAADARVTELEAANAELAARTADARERAAKAEAELEALTAPSEPAPSEPAPLPPAPSSKPARAK